MLSALILAIIAAVSFYTATYALWAWRQKKRRGAVGVFILSWLTLVTPVAVWLYHNVIQ